MEEIASRDRKKLLMKFLVVSNFWQPSDLKGSRQFVLKRDNWDDYNYKTLFHLYYVRSEGNAEEIGSIKILQRGRNTPELKNGFEFLGEDFCSLGQGIDFYEKLLSLGKELAVDALKSLRDSATDKRIRESFEMETGFQVSLLRYSEGVKSIREAENLFGLGQPEHKDLSIEFSCVVPGAKAPHKFSFSVSANDGLPNRIMVLVGKNGTGKTQVLARLANKLSGYLPDSGDAKLSGIVFSRYLAVSLSPFDEFEKPDTTSEDRRSFSYRYCGFRGNLKDENMFKSFRKNLDMSISEIEKLERRKKLEAILSDLLEMDGDELVGKLYLGETDTVFSKLSSGQASMTSIFLELVAHIRRESLILFDEPETHLHPSAMGRVLAALQTLLKEYDSYALVATHSPIVVQNVPGKYVKIFDREGNFPMVRDLPIESFGENLSTIDHEIFGYSGYEGDFSSTLKEMIGSGKMDNIETALGRSLGFLPSMLVRQLKKNG